MMITIARREPLDRSLGTPPGNTLIGRKGTDPGAHTTGDGVQYILDGQLTARFVRLVSRRRSWVWSTEKR